MNRLRLGTRGSRLALVQSRHVQNLISKTFPEVLIEEVIISTLGDKVTSVPLFQVGGQGLFIREIERALQDHQIDLAVHSLKDMPHALGEGLCLASVSKREDPRDALITRSGEQLSELPIGAVIGTSSLRRQSQLLALRKDLTFVALRGNLDTRLKKLEDGEADAIVLAAAGLVRLGLAGRISQIFSLDELTPAAGQGALGIECRSNDLVQLGQFLDCLSEWMSAASATAERAFLETVQGGCQVPLGVHASHESEGLLVRACIGDPQGSKMVRTRLFGPVTEADRLGRQAAETLMANGGREIWEAMRTPPADV